MDCLKYFTLCTRIQLPFLESMSQTTTQSRGMSTSFHSWASSSTPTPKQCSDSLQVLPTVPHTSGSDQQTALSTPNPCNSGSEFMRTPDAQTDGPPSYLHALSHSEPTSYRFVQDSAFSMTLVTQNKPFNIAYNISVGVNVWMPSEHITLVRRQANPEGPVLARLE
jgi:hypothetical protein